MDGIHTHKRRKKNYPLQSMFGICQNPIIEPIGYFSLIFFVFIDDDDDDDRQRHAAEHHQQHE